MCCTRTRSLSRDILIDGLAKDFVAKVRAQRTWGVQVDAATDELRQFVLDADERESRRSSGLEFDQHVDVAIGCEVLAQYGTKQRESSDRMRSANLGQALALDSNAKDHPARSYQ